MKAVKRIAAVLAVSALAVAWTVQAQDKHDHAAEAAPAAHNHAPGESCPEEEAAKKAAAKPAADAHNHAPGETCPSEKAEAKPAADAHNHAAGEPCPEEEAAAKKAAAKPAADAHNHAAGETCPSEKAEAKPAADAHNHAPGETCPSEKAAAGAAQGADPHAGHDHSAHAEHTDEVTLTTDSLKANGIGVEPVGRRALDNQTVVPGRVSYNLERMAHVSTTVDGRVSEVRAKLGDVVKQGDVLFVIESPALGEAQSDYLQRRTEVDIAATALDIATSGAERARRLAESKAIAASEFITREGDQRKAAGALQAAEAALRSAENKLQILGLTQQEIRDLGATAKVNPRYFVRAPIAGTVIEREATLGEVVDSGQEALLVLADMTKLWVLADLPENQLHRVSLGSSATVSLDALGSGNLEGMVSYISPSLDTATRTAQVRIEVSATEAVLRAGMFARVRISLSLDNPGQTHLAVPQDAIHNVEGGPAVFVEIGPNRFLKQAVEVGEPVGGMVPITSGLEEGRRIVTAGAFILKAELAKGIMEGKTCSGH